MTTTHLVTSHGADFFGEDRYPLKQLQQIADAALYTIPRADAEPLAKLLTAAGSAPREIDPAHAAHLADLLTATAKGRWTPPKVAAPARLLATAATNAASAGQSWTWTPATA
jgi:hypothetical protein